MKTLFVDTSAWAALYNSKDRHHVEAKELLSTRSASIDLVTTDFVIDEPLTLLLVRIGYPVAVACGKALFDQRVAKIASAEADTLRDTWDVFKKFNHDKKWSFTDCLSYVVMKQWGIDTVFTFDRTDFGQMGVRVVPKE